MELVKALRARGVIVHSPESSVLQGIDPERFEAGVEIFPGTTIRGAHSLFGAGTCLGKAGGGYFENVRAGRGVDLYGGYFEDCVFLDGAIVRGYAEMRGGTLMSEGAEAAQHVGYKMTILLPFVVAGSLINFCDALFAGGTSRSDHSEIGSCLALYNFTPWGDKFASQFGDIPRGVFLRSPRIFVGGQTQIVSPIKVGYGSVIPAGCAVRRSVPDGRLYGERMPPTDTEFDPSVYGGLFPKFSATAEFVGNLRALELWYQRVRLPAAASDPFLTELYTAALAQVSAGVGERIKRLAKIVAKLPASRARHQEALVTALPKAVPLHERRIAEHTRLIEGWSDAKARLGRPASDAFDPAALASVAAAMSGSGTWTDRLAALDDATVSTGVEALQTCVDWYAATFD